ncbi:type I secretion system permease/ATPase, partial [Vibrio vulnificus]
MIVLTSGDRIPPLQKRCNKHRLSNLIMSNNEGLTLICIHFYLSIISGNREQFKENTNLTKTNNYKEELEKIKKENKVKITTKHS